MSREIATNKKDQRRIFNKPKVGQKLFFLEYGIVTIKERGVLERGKNNPSSEYSILEDSNGNIVLNEDKKPVWFYDDFLTEDNFVLNEQKTAVSLLFFEMFGEHSPVWVKDLFEQAKQKEKEMLCDLVQSLKDYTLESQNILGHDEREPIEFVEIFLNKQGNKNN